MASINKVIIVGRLGQDPEVRQFQNGGNLTTINVATSERWTDKTTGEQKEQTEWHRVSMFNRLGEIAAQFLRKGALVYIEGSLHTRKYTDSQGIERYSTEVRATQMQMLDRRDNGGQPSTWNGQVGTSWGNQNDYNNRGGANNHFNHQNGGNWNNPNQGYPNGGFDNGNFQGGHFNQNYQPQNGFNQPQNAPSYPNNNPNQGFGQANNPAPMAQNTQSSQGMGVPSVQNANAFMSGEKPAPKAVTPPTDGKPSDDDLPF